MTDGVCDYCGRGFPDDELDESVEGLTACGDCVDPCQSCGDLYPVDQLAYNDLGDRLCPGCRDAESDD